MPITVSLAELRGVMRLGATSPADSVLQPAATAAALLANEDLASCGYSDERLASIALYLAAHFAAGSVTGSAAGTVVSESTGRSSVTYASGLLTAENLRGTSYGQVALALDTKGCLRRLVASRRASINVFPTREESA